MSSDSYALLFARYSHTSVKISRNKNGSALERSRERRLVERTFTFQIINLYISCIRMQGEEFKCVSFRISKKFIDCTRSSMA